MLTVVAEYYADTGDAELLLNELQNTGFAPAWKRIETEAAYRASLGERIDLIFSDFSLPQFSTKGSNLTQAAGLTPAIGAGTQSGVTLNGSTFASSTAA